MARLDDAQVRAIASALAERLGGQRQTAPAAAAPAPTPACGEGIHASVDQAVAAANRAFREFQAHPPSLRTAIVDSIRQTLLPEAERLARLARDETGLGRYEDKVRKNRLVTEKTPGPEVLAPSALSGDRGLTLFEAAPFGVLAAITPTTNPTSTIICNSIGMLAAGNSVVFNAHPNAKECSAETVRLLNRAVKAVGGPDNLVNAVAQPTIESAQALMHHGDVRVLVVTGGAGVVREAMSSGKRAICAGPGNPPVVVDETADLDQAGRDIVAGASLDNNIICVDEKELFVVEQAADGLLASMQRHGAYKLTAGELRRLESVIFSEQRGPGKAALMAKEWIGQDAARILEQIGVSVGPEIRLVVAEVPAEHPLVWSEQMMPVLPMVRVPEAETAIDMAIRAERGNGHSAAMHSHHLGRLSRMAREINSSIFVKNGPCAAGLGAGGEGHCSFSIASPTGEGLTGPRSFSRERRCVLVDQFRIV
jgi:aldehyde dehydrogenase